MYLQVIMSGAQPHDLAERTARQQAGTYYQGSKLNSIYQRISITNIFFACLSISAALVIGGSAYAITEAGAAAAGITAGLPLLLIVIPATIIIWFVGAMTYEFCRDLSLCETVVILDNSPRSTGDTVVA